MIPPLHVPPPDDSVLDAVPEGCVAVPAVVADGPARSWVSGDPHGERLRVRYYWRAADSALLTRVWFGALTEGPPGHVHGGALASVLDSTLGAAAWKAGHPVVAAKLEVSFREMVPLGTVALAEATVASVDGRKVRMQGKLRSPDGEKTFATAEGLFIELPPERVAELAERYARFRGQAPGTQQA